MKTQNLTCYFYLIVITLFFLTTFSHPIEAKYVVRPQDRAVLHNNQGVGFLYQQHDIDKAIFEFKTAVEISPEYAEAWSNLGIAYKFKKDYNAAIEAFNKATKIDKEFAGAWTGLGTVYNALKDYNKAISCFKKANSSDKKYADAYYNSGLSYKELGNLPEAIKNFKKTTEANPDHYLASIELGQIYLSEGKYEDALIRFKVAVETNPKSTEAWFGLADLYQKQNNPSKAQEALNRALATQPNSASAHIALGSHYLNEKNLPLAREEIRKAKALDPDDPLIIYNLALVDFTEGDNARKNGSAANAAAFYRKAIAGFQQTLQLSPSYTDAAYNIGYAYHRLGEKEKAKESFQKALKIDSNHIRTLLALGILEGEMGNTNEAKNLLCRFIREAPSGFDQEKKNASNLIGGCEK